MKLAATPPPPTAYPTPDLAPALNPLLRAPMPASAVRDADTVRQWHTQAIPQTRIWPPSATGNPVTGAQAASQAITIVQQGSGLLLETNSQKNAIQGTLNLVAGSNIQLASDAFGGVTVAGTATGDGLVHGDKIWAVDPAYVILRDDFISSSTGIIGQLGWNAFGGITSSAYESGTSAANIGEWSWVNNGIAGNTGGIMLFPAPSTGTFQFGLPILDFPGWKAIFIWRFNFLSQSSGNPMSFAHTAPAISDSTIKLEAVFSSLSGSNARNNTQGIVVDTGLTPVMDKYYRLEISCITSGVVTMSLNGSTPSIFNLSPMVVTAAAGSTHQASVGLARMTLNNANGKQPWFAGSLVTIAGDTATFNGIHTTNPIEGTNNGIIVFASGATVGTAAAVGWTATGFPALFPIFNWGNDTVAGPTSDTRILVDYFGFVWNKGLAGATNPTATLPRYW